MADRRREPKTTRRKPQERLGTNGSGSGCRVADLLTVGQAAERLSCSVRHIYDLRRTGKLKFTKIARRIRFAPSEIDAFIGRCLGEAGRVGAA